LTPGELERRMPVLARRAEGFDGFVGVPELAF